MLYNNILLRSASGPYREILERINDFYDMADHANQEFDTQAQIDCQFLAGSQHFYNNLYGPYFKERTENFYFNRIRPVVNGISGRQRQNRKTTVVKPRENADQETADELTKALLWVHENDTMLQTISTAFTEALTTGISLLQLWIDYRSDPINGDIRLDSCPYNTFIIDPHFTKHDLSDCTGILRRNFLTKREVLSLLPAYADEIASLSPGTTTMQRTYSQLSQKLFSYDEFHYRDYRQQTLIVDPKTGFFYEWTASKDALETYMSLNQDFKVIENEIPTVKCAIIVEGTVLCNDNFIGLDSYPFVPVLGYFQKEITDSFAERIQGVVRSMRDPQYIYNRRLILEAQNLEASAQSGWIYKADSLVNPDDLYKTGTGRAIAVKYGHSINEALTQIQPQVIPPTTQELRKAYADEILRDAGYSEELLGTAQDDVAGVLSMLRQGGSLITLETLFDNLDYAQKLIGNKVLSLVQTQFLPSKLKKILQKDEISPSFSNKLFGVYDCVVQEGYYTSTQRQMQFAQLMELKKLGVTIPDTILLQSATIQNKDEILKAMNEQQQQQQQQQQQEMQGRAQELQAEIEVLKAKAQADKALAAERVSDIQENKFDGLEKRAEAAKDREQANLTAAKTMREIQQIDIDELERLLALAKTIRKDIYEQTKEQEYGLEGQQAQNNTGPIEQQRYGYGSGVQQVNWPGRLPEGPAQEEEPV